MTLEIILLINALLFIGAYIQGIIGFGIGILCASIFAVLVPQMVPGPMILLSTILAIIMLLRGRREVDLTFIKWPILGSLFGIVCAGWVVSVVTASQFDIVFGVLLLILVVMSLLNVQFSGTLVSLIAGYLSGLMGTITAIGGPPMGILMQQSQPNVMRANLALFFLVSSIIAICTLVIIDALAGAQVYLCIVSTPGMLLGYALSQRVKLFQQQLVVSRAILGVSFICSIYVMVRGIRSFI